MKNRVAIIILRFGSNNEFFNIWLKSASLNTDFDFLLFTDSKTDYVKYFSLYNNIHFFLIDKNQVEERIRNKTSISYSFKSGYKLCDFKPCLGLIFDDYIDKYDFWGYCDTDLIFGSISNFVTDEILDSYDRLFMLGHFSLYRNTEKMKLLFMSDNGGGLTFKSVCSTDKIIGFDEYNGMHKICVNKKISYYTNDDFIYDIDIFHYDFFKGVECKISKDNYLFYWENGHLFAIDSANNKNEIMYVHFQKRNIHVLESESQIDNMLFYPNKVIFNINYDEINDIIVVKKSKFVKMFYYFIKKISFYKKRIKDKIKK